MGSAGSGSFGTYRINGSSDSEGNNREGSTGVGSGNMGFGTGEVECPKSIENIRLEDIATSEYYVQHQSLPSYGEAVSLRSKIHNGRLVVENLSAKEVLGNLPT